MVYFQGGVPGKEFTWTLALGGNPEPVATHWQLQQGCAMRGQHLGSLWHPIPGTLASYPAIAQTFCSHTGTSGRDGY